MRIPDYRVYGEGEYTVFLLHGAYGSAQYWLPQVQVLREAGYRVVAWDTPGYGLSPLPEGPRSIEAMADEFCVLLDLVGAPGKHNILIGHSMGGIIAPKVATLKADRIAALVVSATVGSFGERSEEYREKFIAERVKPLDEGQTLRDAAPKLIKTMFGPTSKGDAVDLVKHETTKTPDATFRESIRSIVNYNGRPVLESLRVPTLSIAGEHDKIGSPELMQEIVSSVEGAEFHCVKGAAHYSWAENPDDFNGVLFAFLDRVLSNG